MFELCWPPYQPPQGVLELREITLEGDPDSSSDIPEKFDCEHGIINNYRN